MDANAITRIERTLIKLCAIPGLSGHEKDVAAEIRRHLLEMELDSETDTLGNLFATIEGQSGAPSVLLFAHLDQLGFVVRKIEQDGFLRFERLGGVPEKTLPGQRVVISTERGANVPGIIAAKSHHATTPEEKYAVLRCGDLYIDAGFETWDQAESAGIRIGSPVVYRPWMERLNGNRVAGSAIDDRAGCAVVLDVARKLREDPPKTTVHLLFSVQEEFNLQGVVPAARRLSPDIAFQVDLILATDTPDMRNLGDVQLGGGLGISMYSFHGRGTLNGVIPHPALVALLESTAGRMQIPIQRSVHMGALTDLSHVQTLGHGVACLDTGFPLRYSHSSAEMCDLGDLHGLSVVLAESIRAIDSHSILNRSRDGKRPFSRN